MLRDFSTDVVGITEAHLSSDFWLNKLAKQNHKADILMSAAQIEQFNKRLIVKNPYLSSPLLMPNFLTNVELKEKVNQISSVPTASRFYVTGKRVTTENYADYIKNTNQLSIGLNNKVLFALVVKRTALRRFPTDDKVYKEESDQALSQSMKNTGLKRGLEKDLDMFQESALFPRVMLLRFYISQKMVCGA